MVTWLFNNNRISRLQYVLINKTIWHKPSALIFVFTSTSYSDEMAVGNFYLYF